MKREVDGNCPPILIKKDYWNDAGRKTDQASDRATQTKRRDHEPASRVENDPSSLSVRTPNGRRGSACFNGTRVDERGVHCDPDSRQLLEDAGVVTRIGSGVRTIEAARKIVSTFTVAKGPKDSIDIRVDLPGGVRSHAFQ